MTSMTSRFRSGNMIIVVAGSKACAVTDISKMPTKMAKECV